MILKARATNKQIKELRQGDEVELELYNDHDNNQKIKTVVKVISFIKEPPRCYGCTCYLKGKAYKFRDLLFCEDCFPKYKEQAGKMRTHKPTGKEFGGIMTCK